MEGVTHRAAYISPILMPPRSRAAGGRKEEKNGKSVKDIQSLTLIQSQFFDCAPLLSGILKIFLAADYQLEFVTAFLYIAMPTVFLSSSGR